MDGYVVTGILLLVGAGFLLEKRRRRTHPVPPGYQEDLELPHTAEWELYHNALSLCSMKTRFCLAELEIFLVARRNGVGPSTALLEKEPRDRQQQESRNDIASHITLLRVSAFALFPRSLSLIHI